MAKQRLVEQLWEAATTKDDIGMSKFDEAKLRKALEGNDKLMARNKDIFEANEPNAKTCPMYDPCPICMKCLNKASHLYARCQKCKIPICTHTYKDRVNMIRRKNFAIKVTTETYNKMKEGK